MKKAILMFTFALLAVAVELTAREPLQPPVMQGVPPSKADLGQLQLIDTFGKARTVEQILTENDTDGFLVLRDNAVLSARCQASSCRY